MHLVLVATLLLALLCACAPKTAPTPPAAQFPRLAITPAKFLGDETTSAARTATNPTLWEITIVRVPEGKLNQLGLNDLFALPRETNRLIMDEIDLSPISGLARSVTNVNLSVHSGVHAALCTSSAASNLLASFRLHADVEIIPTANLSAPPAGQAQFFSGGAMPIVTGIKTNTSTVTAVPTTAMTTNLSLGDTVTLRSIQIGNDTILSAVSRIDSFRGYAEGSGKEPHYLSPQFDVTVFGTRTALRPEEVLLLGSPTVTTIQYYEESVPRLSDLPFFGQLFVKTRTYTNRFRCVVLICRKPE